MRQRHKHHKPPQAALISPSGDKTVSELKYKGRIYTLHPTKGWRSRSIAKLERVLKLPTGPYVQPDMF